MLTADFFIVRRSTKTLWNSGEITIASTQSTLTPRRYLVLLAVTLTAAFGDTFLSRGMKDVGPVSIHHLPVLLAALKIPWVFTGIILLIGFFASYLTALSWADLTFVLPATSLGYIIIPFLSHFWLHEHISSSRWAGILLVTIGVGFVAHGPSYTHHGSAPADEDFASVARGEFEKGAAI